MKKQIKAEQNQVALTTSESKPVEKIPPELEQFVGIKDAAEFLASHGVVQAGTEAVGGLMFGLLDMGVALPEFAKRASKQFWKYFVGKQLNLESYKDAGVFARMIELRLQQNTSKPESNLEKQVLAAAKPIVAMMEAQARAATPEETAQYYIGRARGDKLWERIQDANYLKMIKRAPLYIIISVAWRKFETFQSQAEAERWLRDEKIITDQLNSSEVRAVFRVLGLRYRGPGRPKKT